MGSTIEIVIAEAHQLCSPSCLPFSPTSFLVGIENLMDVKKLSRSHHEQVVKTTLATTTRQLPPPLLHQRTPQ